MNPELSRRVAAAFQTLPLGSLSIRERFEIADLVERADALEDLPVWLQDLVLAAPLVKPPVRIAVRRHGEVGPVLVNADQHFMTKRQANRRS